MNEDCWASLALAMERHGATLDVNKAGPDVRARISAARNTSSRPSDLRLSRRMKHAGTAMCRLNARVRFDMERVCSERGRGNVHETCPLPGTRRRRDRDRHHRRRRILRACRARARSIRRSRRDYRATPVCVLGKLHRSQRRQVVEVGHAVGMPAAALPVVNAARVGHRWRQRDRDRRHHQCRKPRTNAVPPFRHVHVHARLEGKPGTKAASIRAKRNATGNIRLQTGVASNRPDLQVTSRKMFDSTPGSRFGPLP